MDFIATEIQDYAEEHTLQESEALQKINRNTHLQVLKPRMLSGHLQGRYLSMLSHLVSPKFILEIGTFTGYSAVCLAEGLAENGKVVSLEVNEEYALRAIENIKSAGFESKIEVVVGNALDSIEEINEEIDFVFIDADKANYLNYFQKVLPKVRKGGLILADNVLWSGKVVGWHKKHDDKDTLAIKEFNDVVHQDDRVENVLLPIRDGLMMLRKK